MYSVYAILKNIRKKETSPCGDCNGCDIKKEITKNLKTPVKVPASCGCNETQAEHPKVPMITNDPATCGHSAKKNNVTKNSYSS